MNVSLSSSFGAVSNVDGLSVDELRRAYAQHPRCPGCGRVSPRKLCRGVWKLEPEPEPGKPEKKSCCGWEGGISVDFQKIVATKKQEKTST